MALAATHFSVLTSAALELTDGTPIADGNKTYSILVKNTDGTNPVYLGPTGVTSANGYLLAAGEILGIDLAYGERLYARATGGTVVVHVLQSKF